MRCAVQGGLIPRPQAAVQFHSCCKVLAAQMTILRACGQPQRAASADSITELPGLVRQILFRDEVSGNVPSPVVASQNELGFNFVIAHGPQFGIGPNEVASRIEAHDLLDGFIGVTDVLELDVDDGIHPVFIGQGPESVFPPQASKNCAVVKSLLALQIEFTRPPARDAIFEFSPIRQITIGHPRDTQDQIGSDLQISPLFHVVTVGNEIHVIRSSCQRGGEKTQQEECAGSN